MNKILAMLACCITLLTALPANADIFGNADDHYAGVQISIPLEVSQGRHSLQKIEYSALLINQRDGFREGLAFIQRADGIQSLEYLQPSRHFKPGLSRISDYTLPLMQLDNDSVLTNNVSGFEAVVYLAAGLVVFAKIVDDVADSIIECIEQDSTCHQDDE
jgi:hypothetical protein